MFTVHAFNLHIKLYHSVNMYKPASRIFMEDSKKHAHPQMQNQFACISLQKFVVLKIHWMCSVFGAIMNQMHLTYVCEHSFFDHPIECNVKNEGRKGEREREKTSYEKFLFKVNCSKCIVIWWEKNVLRTAWFWNGKIQVKQSLIIKLLLWIPYSMSVWEHTKILFYAFVFLIRSVEFELQQTFRNIYAYFVSNFI